MGQSIAVAFASVTKEQRLECEVGSYGSIVRGNAHIVETYIPPEPSTDPVNESEIPQEIEDFETARNGLIAIYEQEIENLRQTIARQTEDITSAEQTRLHIMDAEQMLLQDSNFGKKIKQQIEDGKSAKRAVHDFCNKAKDRFLSMEDEKIRATAEIFENHRLQLLTLLDGKSLNHLDNIPEGCILVTPSVLTKDVTHLITDGHRRIPAMINTQGTNLDHTNISCRGAGITIVRFPDWEELKEKIQNGDPLIIDGTTGQIIINPSSETDNQYDDKIAKINKQNDILRKKSSEIEAPKSRDKKTITILMNAEFATEVPLLHNNPNKDDINVPGIGLFRTEFTLLDNHKPMPENSEKIAEWEMDMETLWYRTFSHMAEHASSKTITVRTVDFEGDKRLNGHGSMCRQEKEAIVRTQFRASLRAAEENPECTLQLMIPTVRGASEYLEYKKMLEQESKKLGLPVIKLGAMAEIISFIETGIQASRPGFISIGTNDLMAGIKGYNRYDPNLAEHYDPTNRTFLKILKKIARRGKELGIPVSLCGDMASDPECLPIIIGSGIKTLSCGAAEIPLIKELAARIDTKEAKKLVKAMQQEPDKETREQMLRTFNKEKLGYEPKKPLKFTPSNKEKAPENAPDATPA